MALIQVLLNQKPGPLPIKGTFQCLSTAELDFIVNGVSYRPPGPVGAAGVEIVITDPAGKEVGYTSGVIDSGLPGDRKATVAQFGQSKLKAGVKYNFEVRSVFPECGSDKEDMYSAVIVY